MLQDTWKEERITYDLTAGWTNNVRLIISGYENEHFALGSIRECTPLGKQQSTISFSEGY
jgi:hypothetical protein